MSSNRTIEERVERLEKAVSTLAIWLVQAQTGFGMHDANGILRILEPNAVVSDRLDQEKP